jgi:hypothetical protein
VVGYRVGVKEIVGCNVGCKVGKLVGASDIVGCVVDGFCVGESDIVGLAVVGSCVGEGATGADDDDGASLLLGDVAGASDGVGDGL